MTKGSLLCECKGFRNFHRQTRDTIFLGQSHEGLKSWLVFVILQTPTSCLIAVFSKRQKRSQNIQYTIPRIRASGFLFGILFLGGNYIKTECV